MVSTNEIDNGAKTKWEKSNVSYENYQEYLSRKRNRFQLNYLDLLYISNFKGGNATINEPERNVDQKLKIYSENLVIINNEFGAKRLADLTEVEIKTLTEKVRSICNLTLPNSTSKIDGFGVSYLSALLNAYFPHLIPILDRRVLINSKLVEPKSISKQGQIKNIQSFFLPLLVFTWKLTASKELSVREVDKEFFIRNINTKK